jgi:O-antigen ligase
LAQLISGNLYFGKSLGTLGEANAVAGFLAIGLFFILETFPKFLLFLPIAAIFVEQSRTGVLVLLPVILGYWKKALPVLGLLVIGLVVFISFQKGISVFENRPLFWKLGIEKILERPVLGYGAESGEFIYNQAYIKSEMPLNNLIIDRSHNLFLDVAMWSGIIGLIIFVYWFYLSFVNLKDLKKKMAIMSFVIFAMLQPLGVSHWVLLFIILNI